MSQKQRWQQAHTHRNHRRRRRRRLDQMGRAVGQSAVPCRGHPGRCTSLRSLVTGIQTQTLSREQRSEADVAQGWRKEEIAVLAETGVE